MSKTKTAKPQKKNKVNKPKKAGKAKKPVVAKKQAIATIHNGVILDRSGSMETVRDSTISGFNENAHKIRKLVSENPKQKHTITLVTFADINLNVHWRESVDALHDLSRESYAPVGSTALCDAMGRTITRLAEELKTEATEDSPVSVLLTVITDGEENASREYNAAKVSQLIESLKGNPNLVWTITYMGANQDVMAAAAKYNIPNSNVAAYTSDNVGTKRAFSHLSDSRELYSKSFARSVASGESLGASAANFFSADDRGIDLTNEANPAPPVMKDLNQTIIPPVSVKPSNSSPKKTT